MSGPEAHVDELSEPVTTGAGYRRLDTEVTCVLTRFELRSAWSLLWMWWAFRKVRAESRRVGGLLRTVFLVESPRVCYIFSVWADERALLEFGTHVHSHVHAARHSFRRVFNPARQRAEIWSTQWRLWAVSNNLSWEGFDLRGALDEEGRRAVDEARMQYHVYRRSGS